MSEEGANAGGNEGGGEGAVDIPTWMASMPDAFKENEGFAQFGEAADFYAKSDELLKADGSALHIPGEDATDEEKGAFAQKMGRPEVAEGYDLAKPDNWPEGVAYDENLEAAFRSFAFESGMSGDMATNAYNWYNKLSIDAHTANAEADKVATEKAIDTLKDEWKGDDFKVNSEKAGRAYAQYADDAGMKFLDETVVDGVALGNHPAFLKLFKQISDTTSDDNMNTGRDNGFNESSDETKAKKRFPNTDFKT